MQAMQALRHPPRPQAQRGAAALLITVVLFFTMMLAAVYVNRNLVFEQRSSANQYRSTQAFEAAEAGLEWAAAQLNSNQRIGTDCLPAAAPASAFRERFVAHDPATARWAGRTWGASAAALQAACVRSGAGWSCSCPIDAAPALAAPAGDSVAPAFILKFVGGDKPGVLRVVSTGCTSLAGACAPAAGIAADPPDATATVEVSFGLLPAIATLPVAAITLRGTLDAGTASLGLHNPDPATGAAVHAGATVAAPAARVTPPAGASPADGIFEADAVLAATAPERLFAGYFGLDKLAWKNQPVVRRVTCSGECAGTLAAAVDAGVVYPMLWVAASAGGAVRIAGPVTLGTPERPVVIVVDGPLQLSGAVRVHGVLYSAALTWTAAPMPGGLLRGAAIVEGDYGGDAAADLVYDATLLASLKAGTGALVRINGSWRDY